ncbi:class F sortase [Pseudofrankia inefficax]|uniref:Peptidase C60 sortase A and B n=1 Tax=Pseudofrankia inefficax (strain DSM 45817 / CECT 9037 / DDB 130130 / EuI1c) TaxID=298654 RepID=E3J9U8_PSEI1|nr:class F sortase [Pseudofrankia inefficax]ADP84601.1 peptidase C60 sortase A and B [Pseudofrankia inefficax]
MIHWLRHPGSRLVRTRRRRLLRRSIAGVAFGAAILGGGGLLWWRSTAPPPDSGTLVASAEGPAEATGTSASTRPGVAPAGAASDDLLTSRPGRLADLDSGAIRPPVRLSEPTTGIDAAVVPAGVDPETRALEVPANATTVVWWAAGAEPGAGRGTVVLAAHVDYDGREGVFFRLDLIRIGDVVTVTDDAGSAHRYRVVTRRHVAKAALADTDVFRADGANRLALITCGGGFDTATHSYLDNLIVLAEPI